MSDHQDTAVIMPNSPPPVSISSYARFMHEHTKRQMEATSSTGPKSSSSSQSSSSSSLSDSSPNGMRSM
ncbi:hypothetical protein K4F52_003234 [Lecanicillium sp. MT-2017a]|nr:hypothetical protein K4F52_003234 [Lecanicillium sp. MT-2017a]